MKIIILLLIFLTSAFAQTVSVTEITENNLKETIFYGLIVSGNAVWVGESDATVGSDRHGYNPQAKVNTITKAITQAIALTPGVGNQVKIIVTDSRTYTETETLPDYVNLIYDDASIANITAGSTSSSILKTVFIPQSGDYTASQITNVPSGGVIADDVQNAIDSLDTDKANLSGADFTGVITSTDEIRAGGVADQGDFASQTTTLKATGLAEIDGSITANGGITNSAALSAIKINRTASGGGTNSTLLFSTSGVTKTTMGRGWAAVDDTRFDIGTGVDVIMTIADAGNVGIKTTLFGTSAVGVLGIGNGTAPTSSPADMVQLYAEDESASSELKARDESGAITQITADTQDYPDDMEVSENRAYVTKDEQVYLGIESYISKYRAIELLQELAWENGLLDTNKYLIKHVLFDPVENWDDNQDLILSQRETKISNWIADSLKYETDLIKFDNDSGSYILDSMQYVKDYDTYSDDLINYDADSGIEPTEPIRPVNKLVRPVKNLVEKPKVYTKKDLPKSLKAQQEIWNKNGRTIKKKYLKDKKRKHFSEE